MLSRKCMIVAMWLVAMMIGTVAQPVCAESPTTAERVYALKAHLAESQTVLRQYEWLETTVVSVKGEEGARTLQRCYYGADGAVQKEPVAQPATQRGLFGNTTKMTKEEQTGYLQKVARLVQQYIPLNPNGIQAVTDDGKLSFSVTDPGKGGQLVIRDFLKRGDRVTLDLDLTNNRPLRLNIKSLLESEGDPMTMMVTFGSLYGTATFAREIVYEDRVREIKVTIQNTGYHTMTQ